MSQPADSFLTEWHRIVSEQDLPSLGSILAEDISFGTPPYWDKLQGRNLANHLLGLIIDTIEEFTYHREWRDGRELALEFTGHVGGLKLQGIDLISLDDQNVIRNLDVLMRPINAVVALREVITPKMAEFLARRSENGG